MAHGYHLTEIAKGEFGKISKIEEEVAELKDALAQSNRVMALVELSDLLCAVEGFIEKEYKGQITIEDLVIMARTTRRAFLAGDRK